MKRPAIAAVVLALAVGIIIGGMAGNPFDGKATAAPPDKVTKVAEQNTDADGNIAVHEQGVVDVNVVNGSPSPGGRLIELGTETVGISEAAEFMMVDVSDCKGMRVMARAAQPGAQIEFLNSARTSPDGSIRVEARATMGEADHETIDGVSTASAVFLGQYPYFQVRVWNRYVLTDVTAWLWCAW